jgi:hypothetical protein
MQSIEMPVFRKSLPWPPARPGQWSGYSDRQMIETIVCTERVHAPGAPRSLALALSRRRTSARTTCAADELGRQHRGHNRLAGDRVQQLLDE